MKIRDFLDLDRISRADIEHILQSAFRLKQTRGVGNFKPFLGKQLAMIFEKASMRTRVSFEVGFNELGGNSIVLQKGEIHLDDPETVEDMGAVLSRYVDMIMIRCYLHKSLMRLAKNSRVPVINGLTDWSHPCQVMADLMTIYEKLGGIDGKTVTWVGDCDNVLRSLVHLSAIFDFKLNIAAPQEWQPEPLLLKNAYEKGAKIDVFEDPAVAVRGCDVVLTDTWMSMGDIHLTKDEKKDKIESLRSYQVNAPLMSLAKSSAIFMHCLPAERNCEVTDEVIDGKQSVVFDEAENRLHVQKAIMTWLLP